MAEKQTRGIVAGRALSTSPRPAANRRTVVLTGASSGIGRATAIQLAQRGDRLVLAARRVDELHKTLELCGGNGRAVACDVGDLESIRALVRSVNEIEGECHVLINNAGIGSRGATLDGPAGSAVASSVITTNLLGAMWCISEFMPLLMRSAPRAAIVNVSSVAGVLPTPGSTIYNASKFGLTGMSEALHIELRGHGIHVATVQPGPVPTEGWPHERLRSRFVTRPLWAPLDAVARVIVRASCGQGGAAPMIPRAYRLVAWVRAMFPWLYRRAMSQFRRERVL